jgi:S-adenosylmethionine synthetase
MYEKVNPSHPDKVADRIAGAIVDLAYRKKQNPRIAVEVLIGHGHCFIITESTVELDPEDVFKAVYRITGSRKIAIDFTQAQQDQHLSDNQAEGFRCGDNGIFKGVPVTYEQKRLCSIADLLYQAFPSDGKFILDDDKLIICQSHAKEEDLLMIHPDAICNPLGYWTGGPDVDSGATNRKLGSDMGDSVTGGGLHGKDLSKADVSVNIYAWLKAQATGKVVELSCVIGDEFVDGKPYSEIVETARHYIDQIGGFEKFAEWGLVR